MIIWALGYIAPENNHNNKNQLIMLGTMTAHNYISQTAYRTKEEFEYNVRKHGEESDDARFSGYTNAMWPPCQYELTRVP